MPTYEYRCTGCGLTFEEFQPISADPLHECPRCKGQVKRLPGPGAGLLFRGKGFYTTDYRSESYKQKEKEEQEKAA